MYLLLFRSIVCPNNLNMTYFKSKHSGKVSWKQHKGFLTWTKHRYFLCFCECRWCFLDMLPRRRISDYSVMPASLSLHSDTWYSPGSAPATTGVWSSSWHSRGFPKCLQVLCKAILSGACHSWALHSDTAFLGLELNFSGFYCWRWWWVCCVVLSHFESSFVCVFCLDKASKKKKGN